MPDYSYDERVHQILGDEARGWMAEAKAEQDVERQAAIDAWRARPNWPEDRWTDPRLMLFFMLGIGITGFAIGLSLAVLSESVGGAGGKAIGVVSILFGLCMGSALITIPFYIIHLGYFGWLYARSEWRRRTGSGP